MSTIYSAPPNPPGEPTDTGEFQSQQGVKRGWVAIVEQLVTGFWVQVGDRREFLPGLKDLYAPEYPSGTSENDNARAVTQWRRGGEGAIPIVNELPADKQPNYFIGEQYLEMNYAPQKIVFARAPVPIQSMPTPMIGYHRTGYKQIYNAIYTIQTRIWAFDDDDGQELFEAIVGAAYIQTVGSALQSVWESLSYQPKRIGTRGTVMEFGLKIGVPVELPPLTPARPCTINQRTSICLPLEQS